MLPGIVGISDGARLLQPLIFRLAADIEEAEHAVLPGLVAKTREVETGHEVFDVEGGEAQGHGVLSQGRRLCGRSVTG